MQGLRRPRQHANTCDWTWIVGCLVLAASVGCRTTAPIHTWRPPQIDAVGSDRIVLMGIQGPDAITEPLTRELLAATGNAPAEHADRTALRRRLAGSLTMIPAERLQTGSEIQLVSGFSDQPSDMAAASAARRQGIRYLLSGQVIQSTGRDDSDQRLSLSWRLTGLEPNAPDGGRPIHVNLESVQADYPQLMSIADPQARLRQAAILETCGLLAASVDRASVPLAHPRLLPASGQVRQANRFAAAGNWPQAEAAYLEVLRDHPLQPAARINSAIAAVARQDFETAKARAVEAIRLSLWSPANHRLARQTLVWIELRQRDYHAAFGLPAPASGWQITHAPPPTISEKGDGGRP